MHDRETRKALHYYALGAGFMAFAVIATTWGVPDALPAIRRCACAIPTSFDCIALQTIALFNLIVPWVYASWYFLWWRRFRRQLQPPDSGTALKLSLPGGEAYNTAYADLRVWLREQTTTTRYVFVIEQVVAYLLMAMTGWMLWYLWGCEQCPRYGTDSLSCLVPGYGAAGGLISTGIFFDIRLKSLKQLSLNRPSATADR